MKGKMRRAAGTIEGGATVEIVAKAEPDADVRAAGASATSRVSSPEYILRDDAGHEETVNTRDFETVL